MRVAADKQTELVNKPVASTLHKAGPGAKAITDNRPSSIAAQAKFSQAPAEPVQAKENNTGLPNQLKAGIENLSGHSMDDVKVHYNSAQPAQINALAYAQGSQIHIAPGQEKHLPHEAWHVAQQKQGRVKPTLQMRGIGINDSSSLELEADVMGSRAMQMKSVIPTNRNLLRRNLNSFTLQGKWILRNGIPVQVADDYVLQDGEHNYNISTLLQRPRIVTKATKKKSQFVTFDKTGKQSTIESTQSIKTHDILQKERKKQGVEVAKRVKGIDSKKLTEETEKLKNLAGILEGFAGEALPKNHKAKIKTLSQDFFTGDNYRAVIKAQDELTQSESTAAFFDGLREGLGNANLAKAFQEFLTQALRAFSALRTPTETVNAPVTLNGEVTGQQHPTSHDQDKLKGGASSHSFSDRLRVENQINTFNNLAVDPNTLPSTLIIGNLLGAIVATLSSMAAPNTASNIPDFNKKRQKDQHRQREGVKKQGRALEDIMFPGKPTKKKVKSNSLFAEQDGSTSPERHYDSDSEEEDDVVPQPVYNTATQGDIGDPLTLGGHRVRSVSQHNAECGQFAVHNVITLQNAQDNNDWGNLQNNLYDTNALVAHGNLENNIHEDQIRQMLANANRSGIPVIGNIAQLQYFIAQYNRAETLGNALNFNGFGHHFLTNVWHVGNIEAQEVINMNTFLQGVTNQINIIINTDAHQQIALGTHWITVRLERVNGQIRLFFVDSLSGAADYSLLFTHLHHLIANAAQH